MKVYIKNKGHTTLTKNDFVAAGGEGEIYLKGSTAFKVYNDPKKMIPVGKINELSVLNHESIIKPEDILLDSKSKPIGYTMKFVSDTYALCQIFTKAFKDRNNITPQITLDLVRYLQNIVNHIHSKNILIVDLNELNFLVDKDFTKIYAIDTDSYKTPGYPATAIMDSIRDRHSKDFSKGTDWFSFGIVSFQMFIGIHPYKGSFKGNFKSLDDRMLNNVSVFHKDVSIPKVCLSFDVIPEVYKHWYRAVFDDGKRLPPPKDLQAVITIQPQVNKVSGSNNFDIKELAEFDSNIIDVLWETYRTVITTSACEFGKTSFADIPSTAKLISLPSKNTVITAWIDNNQLVLKDLLSRTFLPIQVEAKNLICYNNNVYIKSIDSLLQLELTDLGKNIIPTTKVVANILQHATKCYQNVVIQNLLGACYVSIFPNPGEHHQVRLKELTGYKIVDAKYDSGVLIIIGIKHGIYDKFIYRIDKDDSYDVRMENDLSHNNINFVVNDRGICIHINDKEEVEVFSAKKNSAALKVIQDPVISSDIKLLKSSGQILFARENKLYSIKTRP